MQVIYRPNGPYKWFGIIFAVIIVVELLIILLVSTKPLEPASDLCAIFVIGLALCVYLIRQSFKEIIISEESITIRNETKEKQVFSWESLTHAYLRAGYRRKAVVLSRHELTDDGINRLFHLTLADRLVRKECIVIPIVSVRKGSTKTLGFIADKYGLDRNRIKTISGWRYLFY